MIRRLVPLAWLLIVWLALWEKVTFLTVFAGLLVGACLLAFFQPGGGIVRWTLRPIAGLRFAGYFIYQFVIANVHVAWAVMFPSRIKGRQAIVAVPVGIANPGVLAVLASAVSLTPGTSVVEVHTDPSVLYLHVLDLVSAETTRADVFKLEHRLLRAFPGSGTLVEAPAPEGGDAR